MRFTQSLRAPLSNFYQILHVFQTSRSIQVFNFNDYSHVYAFYDQKCILTVAHFVPLSFVPGLGGVARERGHAQAAVRESAGNTAPCGAGKREP